MSGGIVWKRFIDRAWHFADACAQSRRKQSMAAAAGGQYRSWMFVPGHRDRFIEKSKTCGADAILLDLEDGVLPTEKADARQRIAAALGEPWGDGPQRWARVNALSTPWLGADLEEVVRPGLDGICLTKVVRADDVRELAARLDALEPKYGITAGTVAILAAIESARGLLNAPAIADSHPRLAGLMFGAEDFALDLGLGARRENEAAELIHARSAIVVAATAANVLSIDGVYPDLDDPEGLMRDTMQARRLGFTSKSTFNPRQIKVINTVFAPQPDEIAYARRIAEGFRAAEARGDAAVAVGGQLVDRPIVLRALRILDIAGK